MIITGGEPELLWYGIGRHAERVGSMHAHTYALRVCKSCPECSVHVLCFMQKCEKGLCEVTSKKNVKAKDGDTNKEAQVQRGLLALSSSLTVR